MDNNLITKSINNLLSNALKFTPKNGAVNINLYFNDFLEVEIVDNGIGIPKEDIHKIFDRFYQSKNDITKSQGSGIGLSFTKSIIETHGFSISVQSIPKVKTTFKISIPKQFISQINNNTQEVIPKTDNEIIDIKSNKQKTILIVDDHKQLRDYLKSILKDYSFIEAENGKEALNIIKNKRIDLLLTDYMMPVMNGETLVKEVKKQNLKIPIIMLTARVDDFAKLKMLRVGVDGYLNKPFVEEELLLTVKNSLKLYTTIVNTQKTLTLIEKEDLHTKGQEFNEKIVSFILVNIHKTDFSVQDIAKHLNISQSTLNRRTKSIFGQTAQQFILQVKLEEAKKLVIQNPNLSKKEIGYKVGILNTSYLFKKLEERFYKKNIDN